jgi:predicted MFS family arabinose efflux permease
MVVIRSDDPMVLAVAMFAYSALRSPIGSILDAFVVDALRERGEPPESYGRVRLYGSLGFLLGVAGAGWVERAGLPLPAFVDALFVATAIVAFAFPARGEGGPAPVLPALLGLAKQPFLLPLLVTGGLQAMTLSVYDTFLSVHVQAHGLPTLLVGASVGIGVSFETALLAFGRDWLGRMGPARALLFAAASGIPRWILTAIVREPALLVAIQVLHGIGFGAFWVSGVQRMARAAPPHISASAQALWGAATYGVGALIGALLAGQVRERVGTEGIFWMLAVVSVGATASAGWLVWADGTGESGSEADAKSVGIGRLN